jgi:hypothetical protein
MENPLLKEPDVVTEPEVKLQKHLERRLASLLEEFEHWYGRPVTMATLCTVAASAVAIEHRRGLDALATWNNAFSLVYDGVLAAPPVAADTNRDNPQSTVARKEGTARASALFPRNYHELLRCRSFGAND